MAGTQIQYRRGSQAQNDAFTGALGEITVDTTNRTLRVHDGTTAGGNTIVTTYASQTLLNKTLTGPTITGTLSSTGYINTTGNISTAQLNAGQINTTGNVVCAVLNAGAVASAGIVYANSTAQSTSTTTGALEVAGGVGIVGNLNVGDGTLSGGTHKFQGNVVPFTSNTYTLGTNTLWWSLTYSKAVQAQYADLAEIYTSDQQYAPGTVVVFGGEAEVTQSHSPNDPRIAGVVSTEPAYLMNSKENGVAVALQGRVPCRVLGPVSKGDRVVSSHIAGVAQALDPGHYEPGCIIGKALQAIDSAEITTIEVVVGRV